MTGASTTFGDEPVIYKTVNKDVKLIEKFSTDILGNLYKITSKEHPQTIIKKA